jgi:hypothetical protein
MISTARQTEQVDDAREQYLTGVDVKPSCSR